MTSRRRRQHPSSGERRSWPAVLAATVLICLLGTLPLTLRALNVHLQPVAATTSNGVTLLQPPKAHTVALPRVAQPVEAGHAAALLPTSDATREAEAVRSEDLRLRVMLHAAVRAKTPELIKSGSSLPTLILTGRLKPYGAADLARYHALVMSRNHTAVLVDNVFVSNDVQLSLGGTGLRTLYMETAGGKFASIVGWGASLSFSGVSQQQPLTIMGWNQASHTPAVDHGDGRSYIRAIGGSMTLASVRVSHLGFWSGRTGGVAWTGLSDFSTTGGASSSRFTGDAYGAFLSRTSAVRFADDLFEYNELDGVRIHRNSTGTVITDSAASRNGGNGFVISRATRSSDLDGDVADHNGANGFYIDGRPLVNGPSASGGSTAPGSYIEVENSAANDNGKTGILVEGGSRIIIKADQVCAAVTAIAVRYDATAPVLTGNYIGCSPRTGIAVGPSAPGTVVSGNAIAGARMGIVVRDSGQIELDNNHITGATVFGITVRGLSSKVAGVGNVLAGTGFRAVDARAEGRTPALSSTDMTGWAHHVRITFWSYLRFHPLAALWLGIAMIVLIGALRSYRRKLPSHPYAASTRWLRQVNPATSAPPRQAPPRPAQAGSPRTGHAQVWPAQAGLAQAGLAQAGPPRTGPARHRAPARPDPATMPLPGYTAAARAGDGREQPGVAYGQHAQVASGAVRPAADRTRPWAAQRPPMPEPGPGRVASGNGRPPDALRPLPKERGPW